MEGSSAKLCESTSLSALQFVVKGFLCYPKRSLIQAMHGEQTARRYAFRLYLADGAEPHRTFRALEVSDEVGMRSAVLHVVDDLAAAAKSVKNTQFFISDHDITLSAWLGPFALLSNRLRPAMDHVATFGPSASALCDGASDAPPSSPVGSIPSPPEPLQRSSFSSPNVEEAADPVVLTADDPSDAEEVAGTAAPEAEPAVAATAAPL
jgi:hypothetical protein